jgi:hypothetical protein
MLVIAITHKRCEMCFNRTVKWLTKMAPGQQTRSKYWLTKIALDGRHIPNADLARPQHTL